VTEYVAPAPDVTYTEPALVIEHVTVDTFAAPAHLAPAPVIEYIAPSPAVSYPSFCPSFSQLNEALIDLANPQFFLSLLMKLHRCQLSLRKFQKFRLSRGYKNKLRSPLKRLYRIMCNCTMRYKLCTCHSLESRRPLQIRDIPVPPIVEETVNMVQVLPHEHLLLAMECIAPASPVTDPLPNQPLSAAFTSFLERLTEQVVAAPFPQDVQEIIRATVNEPSTAADEARLKRVFAALAERAAQELLAEEVATKPKKAKKGKQKK